MTRVRAALAFVAVVWRMLTRDRSALFFMLVLPVAVIVVIGATFGGEDRAGVGLVRLDADPLSARLAAQLERAEGLDVRGYEDLGALRRAVRRHAVAAGVVLPRDLTAAVRAGRPVRVGFVGDRASPAALTARVAVSGIVDAAGEPIAAAQVVTAGAGGGFEANLALARSVAGDRADPVSVADVGEARRRELSRFSLTAPQNLVLFVFLNAMTAAVLIVVARREGILRRALATPTPVAVVLAGLGLAWLVLALAQSLLILGVGALLFGVAWGDPLAAAALVLAFALVGCGAGLLVGAVGRNEDRVAALAPVTGIVLGALGGCMVPLEVFPPAMEAVAHAVPHYWAVRAWQELVFDGAGIAAIAPSLAALAAFAAAFIALAVAVLRRQLTG